MSYNLKFRKIHIRISNSHYAELGISGRNPELDHANTYYSLNFKKPLHGYPFLIIFNLWYLQYYRAFFIILMYLIFVVNVCDVYELYYSRINYLWFIKSRFFEFLTNYLQHYFNEKFTEITTSKKR